MRRYYDHRVATYRRKYDRKTIDTREGWAKRGYIVIQRRKGEVMYTNGYFGRTAEYFYDTDVKEDRDKAVRYLDRLRSRRNARRRQLARTKKDREHAKEISLIAERAKAFAACAENRGQWRGYLSGCPKVLIFDTETSGLQSGHNVMLSLSYQLIEIERIPRNGDVCGVKILESANFYFDWPEDVSRVTWEAIEVNGLTRKRLSELGTTDRRTALVAFSKAMEQASMVVAHNISFDCGFVKAAANEEGVSIKWPRRYDTMTRMTEYCKLWWYDGAKKYKWPRLEELADILEVDTSDIEFHLSSADVEVTKRCLLTIISRGLDCPC